MQHLHIHPVEQWGPLGLCSTALLISAKVLIESLTKTTCAPGLSSPLGRKKKISNYCLFLRGTQRGITAGNPSKMSLSQSEAGSPLSQQLSGTWHGGGHMTLNAPEPPCERGDLASILPNLPSARSAWEFCVVAYGPDTDLYLDSNWNENTSWAHYTRKGALPNFTGQNSSRA